MSKNSTEPIHIQRLRAIEKRLEREVQEGEMRLRNDIDYAKKHAVAILGIEAATKVSAKNAFLGGLIAKAFVPKSSRRKSRRGGRRDAFVAKDQRLHPAIPSGASSKLGIRSVLEDFVLPVAYGIMRGKVLVAGIKGTGRLLGAFVSRVRRSL